MNERAEFLQKLKNLLEEYDVSISFSVSDCSDTCVLFDEKLVFEHRIDKATLEDETWFYVDGWTCTSRDLPPFGK